MEIPIGLDYSWFLVFALLTWSLASSYYPAEFNNWPPLLYWFVGAVTAIMLFVSVLLHELGHAAIALRYKIPVRSITPAHAAEAGELSSRKFLAMVLGLFFHKYRYFSFRNLIKVYY